MDPILQALIICKEPDNVGCYKTPSESLMVLHCLNSICLWVIYGAVP